jgi:2-polyprenyl-3-methyl-5-hydroxy-6-metoxy-1,4-benzoquinol methylase
MNSEEALVSDYQSKDFIYFQQERQEMLRYIPPQSHTLLEVGCGGGRFGQLLKAKRPVEVWGVELNEHAASIAAQKLDHFVCGAFTTSLSLPSRSFDCIVFNDVLEHLVDPFAALLYSKKLLRDGGVVVASIPNVRYFENIWNLLVHKNWQYTEQGILDRTHLRFFKRRSILDTFEALGYSLECLEGINPLEKTYPRRARVLQLINWLLFNNIEDMRYLQFAVVARPRLIG